MAITIIKSTDIIPVHTIIMLIYGQPGVGKSSFGFTAKKPLNLDFDKGAYRSKQRKDVLQIDSWESIQELMKTPEVIAGFDTIILDTVGRCLDCLTEYIIRETPKLGNKNGNLTQQGWGELKMLFASWMKQLRTLGKDIVLIAHEREEKEGDGMRKRPDMQGGSYAEVIKIADLIGYMGTDNNVPVINFNPCDTFYAKNAANIQTQKIPNYNTTVNFAELLISHAKDALTNMSEEAKKIAETVNKWQDTILSLVTSQDFNRALEEIKNLPDVIKSQVRPIFSEHATAMNIIFDKTKNCFISNVVDPEPEPTPTPPPTEKTKEVTPAIETIPQDGQPVFPF